MTILETTYPLPGATKWSPITMVEAMQVARHFYDVLALEPADGGTYAVRCASGYLAVVGTIDGHPAILHKRPDGSRELNILA